MQSQHFEWVQVSTDKLEGWYTTPFPLTTTFKASMPGVIPMEYFRAVREYGYGRTMRVHAIHMSDSSWWCMTETDSAWRCLPARP